MSTLVPQTKAGGSFAPPITEALLEEYKDLCVLQEMKDLILMVKIFQETPESEEPSRPHPSGRGVIIPLEANEIDRIYSVVPNLAQCDSLGQKFNTLLPGKTRDAAYHLLWYARELALGREPITNDKL